MSKRNFVILILLLAIAGGAYVTLVGSDKEPAAENHAHADKDEHGHGDEHKDDHAEGGEHGHSDKDEHAHSDEHGHDHAEAKPAEDKHVKPMSMDMAAKKVVTEKKAKSAITLSRT